MPGAAGAGDPRRKAELAVIHLGRKALALDDDAYRDWLQQLTGRRSAADLSPAQRHTVIEAMRARGFSQASWGGLGSVVAKAMRGGGQRLRPHQAKVKALWRALWNLGALRDGSDAALDRWIRGRKGAGVEALRFADARACNDAIEGLRDWCRREGFETASGESGVSAKRRLAWTQWQRLVALGQARIGALDGLDAWLKSAGVSGCKTTLDLLTPDELDAAIERLGVWVRKSTVREIRMTGSIELEVPDGCVLTVSGPHRSAAPDDRWQAWVTIVDGGEGRLAGYAGVATMAEAADAALSDIRAACA